ncbi:MAG: PH domain-containing protein [Bacteroidota bacterium]
MSTTTITYRSKVDRWIAVAIGLTVLVSLGTTGLLLVEGKPWGWLIGAVLVGVGAVWPAWAFLTTAYHFSDDQLVIRCGPSVTRVPLDEITAIKPTRDPLSAPALSLDRLRITYGARKQVLISPQDQAAFLKALQERTATLA